MAKSENEKRETLRKIAELKTQEREDRDKRFTAEMNRRPQTTNRAIIFRDMEREDAVGESRLAYELKRAGKTDAEIRYALGK